MAGAPPIKAYDHRSVGGQPYRGNARAPAHAENKKIEPPPLHRHRHSNRHLPTLLPHAYAPKPFMQGQKEKTPTQENDTMQAPPLNQAPAVAGTRAT